MAEVLGASRAGGGAAHGIAGRTGSAREIAHKKEPGEIALLDLPGLKLVSN
jgi:hypothetical protein